VIELVVVVAIDAVLILALLHPVLARTLLASTSSIPTANMNGPSTVHVSSTSFAAKGGERS
jgi:hypothetical protein